MSTTLDELYISWLYRQVADPDAANPSRTHWNLVQKLYDKEFLWVVPNDANRCQDGKDLRYEFSGDLGLDIDNDRWLEFGCTMLELLIGLSRRLSFLGGGEPRDWFWHMIDNLGLRINDRERFPEQKVEEVLEALIWRNFKYNGRGGLFPLRSPRQDQRDAEMWYQLNAYLLECP